MSAPKVSVVCAWYNRADYIRDTIDSLLAQDFDSFEIVVVNDGSSDPRVREILSSYNDSRLRVIHQENEGFVRTIRRAIAESKAPFLAIQGAGDISYPGRLTSQYTFMSAHDEFAICGCGFIDHSVGAGNFQRMVVGPRNERPTVSDLIRGNPFNHGGVMIRRAHYDAVGGYRAFFVNSQDRDLWMRLANRYKMAILPTELYERRIFLQDGISGSFEKTMRQLVYSRMVDFSFYQRQRGETDCVDMYGNLALIQLPKDMNTIKRVSRVAWRFSRARAPSRYEMAHVKRLFGKRVYIFASLAVVTRSAIELVSRNMGGFRRLANRR